MANKSEQRRKGSPETVQQAVEGMRAAKATDAEAALLDSQEGISLGDPDDEPVPAGADPGALPPWAQAAVPAPTAEMAIPPNRTVSVMRLRAELTDSPSKGDRLVLLWNLSVGDEKLANKRAGDSQFDATMEQAKQMVRAIDGQWVDFSGKLGPRNVDQFWDEIGKRCRNLIINHYVRVHSLTKAEQLDFLANCVVTRTSGASISR